MKNCFWKQKIKELVKFLYLDKFTSWEFRKLKRRRLFGIKQSRFFFFLEWRWDILLTPNSPLPRPISHVLLNSKLGYQPINRMKYRLWSSTSVLYHIYKSQYPVPVVDWNVGILVEGRTVWNIWGKRAVKQQQKAYLTRWGQLHGSRCYSAQLKTNFQRYYLPWDMS